MSKPLVTVIVPVRDTPDWLLNTTLESLASQTVPFNAVIVDDGSRDHSTLAALSRWRSRRPDWLFLRSWLSYGVAKARNWGLREVKTEYFAILDSDDLWEPHKLKMQLDEIRRVSGSVCLCGTTIKSFIDDESRSRTFGTPVEPLEELSTPALYPMKQALRILAYNVSICGSNVLFSTADFDKFRPEYNGTDEWVAIVDHLRVSSLEHPLAVVTDHLVTYRCRSGSYSGMHIERLRYLAEKYRYEVIRQSRPAQVHYLRSPEVAGWSERLSRVLEYNIRSRNIPAYGGIETV